MKKNRLMQISGFSVIIPVLQEVKNIPILIERISKIQFVQRNFEVILIDDNSQDGTVELVDHLRNRYSWLRLIVRSQGRSWAKSVLEGIQFAIYPCLIFMDADLSHPPEQIPQMLALLNRGDVDMIIGSRYVKMAGIDEKWPFYRALISRVAAFLVKPLLPSGIKDPLSGFIAIRNESPFLNSQLWNPLGAKLGLEIMVKSQVKNIIEIPIYFKQRQQGVSKLLSLKMVFSYLKQVWQLWAYKLYLS